MKKVLGVDVGVASVGWAMVNMAETGREEHAILGMGVRVIPLSADEKDEFSKGKKQSKNANRRMKRGMRRNVFRFQLRKSHLRDVLAAAGMLPGAPLFGLDKLALWQLRARAASEQIALDELGRVLFHLNQKRGYQSNRKTDGSESDAEDTKAKKNAEDEDGTAALGWVDSINDRGKQLAQAGLTIGQFFAGQMVMNPHTRVKKLIYPRASYRAEFDRIWKTQAAFYPSVLTEELKKAIGDRIIFHQRPLRSVKRFVNGCQFETRSKVLKDGKRVDQPIPVSPLSAPLYQAFRMWTELHNVRIVWTDGRDVSERRDAKDKMANNEQPLTQAQKEIVYALLDEREHITEKELLKAILPKTDVPKAKWNRLTTRMPGNKTRARIEKVLGGLPTFPAELCRMDWTQYVVADGFVNPETGEVLPVIDPEVEQDPAWRFWNLLYSAEDNEKLIATLQKPLLPGKGRSVALGFDEPTARALVRVKLEDGYGSLSTKALRKIVPQMALGARYDLALEKYGFRHSHHVTREEINTQIQDKLEPIKRGELRNPAVERILNQVVNIVNALIDTYGRPDEIHVELARDLKSNAVQKAKAAERIAAEDRRNEEYRKRILESTPLRRVTRKDIEKYRLWVEMGQVSPYEPTKAVGLTELFNGDYDVEHIIPKSRIFDDSFGNKTIASRRMNEEKGNRTAIDYMRSRGDDALKAFTEFVKMRSNAKEGISKRKMEFLLMEQKDIPDDFISRQINETRYISKELLHRLTRLMPRNTDVVATTGSLTSHLRDIWGLDDLVRETVWEKYETLGKTKVRDDKDGRKIKFIENWSKRDDHRHHAVDALVVAFTSRSLIQRLNTLNAHAEDRMSNAESWKVAKPWQPAFREEIKQCVEGILISLKPGKRSAARSKNRYKKKGKVFEQQVWAPRGELHKESVYGMVQDPNPPQLVKIGKGFDPDTIVDARLRALVWEYVKDRGGDVATAFDDLKKFPIWLNRAAKEKLEKVMAREKRMVIRTKLENFRAKDLDAVVDPKVREILAARIAEYGEKKAFVDLADNPVWFDAGRGIKIWAVRTFENLKTDTVRNAGRGYVNPRNNHHAALYLDGAGKLQEHVCQFWDAVNRRAVGLPIVIKDPMQVWETIEAHPEHYVRVLDSLPQPDWTFVQSYAVNELFVIHPDADVVEEWLRTGDYRALSPFVYRVQKLSSGDYNFRHHLETRVDSAEEMAESQATNRSKRIKSLKALPMVKIGLNLLGHLNPKP